MSCKLGWGKRCFFTFILLFIPGMASGRGAYVAKMKVLPIFLFTLFQDKLSDHMNIRLLTTSVVSGVFCGLLTAFWVPVSLEILVWLILIIFTGLIVSRSHFRAYFFPGLFSGILSGITITLTHLTFLHVYIQRHPDESAWMAQNLILNSPRFTLFIIAPVYWVILGLLSGLSAFLFNKFSGKS